MSKVSIGGNRSFKSATDLSAKQNFIVKLSASETVALASAATDVFIGTIENKPTSSGTVSVVMRHGGRTGLVVAGGTITRGDKLTSDSAGKAVTTTTGADQVLGIALESAVAGDVVEYSPCWGLVR
jgi:hypothetical protein